MDYMQILCHFVLGTGASWDFGIPGGGAGLGGRVGLGTTPSQILRDSCASEHRQSWRMNVQRSELWLLNSQQLLCTKYFLPGPNSTLDLGLASSKYIAVYEFKIGD